jgi:hypothetical protein
MGNLKRFRAYDERLDRSHDASRFPTGPGEEKGHLGEKVRCTSRNGKGIDRSSVRRGEGCRLPFYAQLKD